MVKQIQFKKPGEEEELESEELEEVEESEEQPVKKAVKKTSEFALVQVPTQYGLGIQTPNGEVISSDQLLVDLANKVEVIYQAIVGK